MGILWCALSLLRPHWATATGAVLSYVRDAGCIMEHGRHDELLARSGLDAQLYARQSRDLASAKAQESATGI
jgi:hypothetical protein